MGREARVNEQRKEMKPRVLFTHIDLDGLTCAVLFKKAYPNSYIFFTDYKKGLDYEQIDDAIMQIVPELPEDVNILLSDISCSETTAEYLNQRGKVGMIDHHKTALPLTKYPWAKVDLDKCGAMMMYELLSPHFHMTDLWPLTEHADLYDRWQTADEEKFIHAKKLSNLLELMGRQLWVRRFMDNPSIGLSAQEVFLLTCDYMQKERYIVRSLDLSQVLKDVRGNLFASVIADKYISELGNEILATAPPEIEYVVMTDPRERSCSMIGRGNVDLGELAKSISEGMGGGHPRAAGFPMEYIANLVAEVGEENVGEDIRPETSEEDMGIGELLDTGLPNGQDAGDQEESIPESINTNRDSAKEGTE